MYIKNLYEAITVAQADQVTFFYLITISTGLTHCVLIYWTVFDFLFFVGCVWQLVWPSSNLRARNFSVFVWNKKGVRTRMYPQGS